MVLLADETAGTVCLFISLLGTASGSLRRTERELVEELDDEVVFTSLVPEEDVVFRVELLVVLLLLAVVVVVAAIDTFLGGRAARFCSDGGAWFREVPDLLRSGRSGIGGGAAVVPLSLMNEFIILI